MKLHFPSAKNDPFFPALKGKVDRLCRRHGLEASARRLLWIKFAVYAALFTAAYISLYYLPHRTTAGLCLHYILIGLSGILLAFNAAHDAVHRTFSKRRWVNDLIFTVSFNLQGVSAYLWRIRHIASHHVFPNVAGCDADIDDNPFIRLSASQPQRPAYRYQHLYATVLYAVYTVHWILFKDFLYLCKRQLANLKHIRHRPADVLDVVCWKAFYGWYMIAMPFLLLPYSGRQMALAVLSMHAVISIFFVLTLIISHLCMETAFPQADAQGALPHNYYRHQLAVSLDYHPRSRIANWIFGGFNAHAAHHLFPRLPHTAYPVITKAIQHTAKEYGCPYHELSIPKAIRSHYRYLKVTGNAA
jgi:linoleoyl-CoA desaturase